MGSLQETGANEVEMNNMSKWVHFLGEANTTLESKLQEAVDQLQARAAATDKLALEVSQSRLEPVTLPPVLLVVGEVNSVGCPFCPWNVEIGSMHRG